jgi:hypothetical protein
MGEWNMKDERRHSRERSRLPLRAPGNADMNRHAPRAAPRRTATPGCNTSCGAATRVLWCGEGYATSAAAVSSISTSFA